MQEPLDYARSFITFFTKPHQGGNIARIQVDARCEVDGWGESGGAETFYLIVPCRSEKMYEESGPLFQMPNYEFCGIFTDSMVSLIRTQWTSDREFEDIHPSNERFERVAIDLKALPSLHLKTNEEIVGATLANKLLVARTFLRDEATGISAKLEYPVKTMNVTRDPHHFQVDTGPIIVPLFDSGTDQPIGRFAIAHVVYWTFDRAEFVLRVPHVVGEQNESPVSVTDYTEIRITSAAHEIWGEA